MQLLKASFYTAVSTSIRIITALVVVKLIAINVGPSGMGKIGQFMSLMAVLSMLAGGGISNGITKYIAEYRDDKNKLEKLISTGLSFTFIVSIIMCFIGISFSYPLTVWLLGSENYVSLIWILSIAQFSIAGNNFLIAITNGFKDVKRLSYSSITGTIVGFFIMLALIVNYHLYGALLALVLMQAVLIIVTIFFVINSKWFNPNFFNFRIDKIEWHKLMHYSIMTITTALCSPISQMLIRDHLASIFSWEDVGYWQAVTKISDAYLLFITTTLTAFYLPRLSEISLAVDLRKEITKAFKIFLPCVLITALIIYLLRDLIIHLLFTEQFFPMRDLFFYQLLGDVFKIGGWLLAFILLAKAMTKTFILTEIIFSSSFVILTYLFSSRLGMTGVTVAFALNSFFYWLVMIFINFTSGHLRDKKNENTICV